MSPSRARSAAGSVPWLWGSFRSSTPPAPFRSFGNTFRPFGREATQGVDLCLRPYYTTDAMIKQVLNHKILAEKGKERVFYEKDL